MGSISNQIHAEILARHSRAISLVRYGRTLGLLAILAFFLLGCSKQKTPTEPYLLSAADFAGIDWLTVDVDSLQDAWKECCPDRFETVWPSKIEESSRPDQMPKLQHMPTPNFPLKAKAMEAQGMVQVNILVGADSTVWAATIQRGSGLPLGFEEEALRAALRSKWLPALRKGAPTWSWVSYPFHFTKP